MLPGSAPPSTDWDEVVVDTNVLLSAALLSDSLPARLVDRLLAQHRLVFTPATFAELETRLWRPKFDRYLTMQARRSLLIDLRACALWVTPPSTVLGLAFSRDRDDDAFIHAALASGARHLISGDDDLLSLDPLPLAGRAQALRIVTPRTALDALLV